jgi:hypothetical protein
MNRQHSLSITAWTAARMAAGAMFLVTGASSRVVGQQAPSTAQTPTQVERHGYGYGVVHVVIAPASAPAATAATPAPVGSTSVDSTQSSGIHLDELMTRREWDATGVARLRPDERAALEAWVQRYRAQLLDDAESSAPTAPTANGDVPGAGSNAPSALAGYAPSYVAPPASAPAYAGPAQQQPVTGYGPPYASPVAPVGSQSQPPAYSTAALPPSSPYTAPSGQAYQQPSPPGYLAPPAATYQPAPPQGYQPSQPQNYQSPVAPTFPGPAAAGSDQNAVPGAVPSYGAPTYPSYPPPPSPQAGQYPQSPPAVPYPPAPAIPDAGPPSSQLPVAPGTVIKTGVSVQEVRGGNRFVALSDGSMWDVYAGDRGEASVWHASDPVYVRTGTTSVGGGYDREIVNTTRNVLIRVKYVLPGSVVGDR